MTDPTPMIWAVFDGNNIQRIDDEADDNYGDLHAVADAVRHVADGFEPGLHGAEDDQHVIGCAIATLVACYEASYHLGSVKAQNLAWEFLDSMEKNRAR